MRKLLRRPAVAAPSIPTNQRFCPLAVSPYQMPERCVPFKRMLGPTAVMVTPDSLDGTVSVVVPSLATWTGTEKAMLLPAAACSMVSWSPLPATSACRTTFHEDLFGSSAYQLVPS